MAFCGRFSDVISRENQWWRREFASAFLGYSESVNDKFVVCPRLSSSDLVWIDMCVLSVRFKRIDGIKMLRFISVELYGAVRVEKTISALYKRISATGERGGGEGDGFHLLFRLYTFSRHVFFLSN